MTWPTAQLRILQTVRMFDFTVCLICRIGRTASSFCSHLRLTRTLSKSGIVCLPRRLIPLERKARRLSGTPPFPLTLIAVRQKSLLASRALVAYLPGAAFLPWLHTPGMAAYRPKGHAPAPVALSRIASLCTLTFGCMTVPVCGKCIPQAATLTPSGNVYPWRQRRGRPQLCGRIP